MISEPDSNDQEVLGALYSLSQLAYISEDYRKSVDYLLQWFDLEEIPSSDGKATPSTERPENAEERVFKKRYDDLKRHYDSTLGKHKDEVRTLRTQLEQSANKIVPPKSKEELEAWKKEYPDVYQMVETKRHMRWYLFFTN